ncbi:vitamin B12-dependent ribonucleotide reductase [Halalkalibacillus halophilus]|uniref:vitamin B12-dependent ribonucleotide reductase n=1 Tax=Halalkalibacillus halophilus TaxID=392827 RepID=UPI0004250430|nr:vitamin B12-dependent ribonucleotide reductase [Halalkalibacillus halophilus]
MQDIQTREFVLDTKQLNEDIKQFPQVHPITSEMVLTHKGVSRLVMLDRYAFKDTEKRTLKKGDFVVLTIKEDPKFPARGTGFIKSVDISTGKAIVKVENDYQHVLENETEQETGLIERSISVIDKPLEVYYEQIAARNATGLAAVETTPEKKQKAYNDFYQELSNLNFVPAGRVLYGAGSNTDVTYFNCYVMPFVRDSREGISDHRKQVMEIMSRGGGVGTNGSTLRPKNSLARGVNGKSSGSVSWLDDIAKLTHLVEQGGSRRGAQMIMLNDWHPDLLDFIISKMQNPRILRYLIENIEDETVQQIAKDKLKFTPLSLNEIQMYQGIVNYKHIPGQGGFSDENIRDAENKLRDEGTYSVHNPDFLTGANISVCITDDFMKAVENDEMYELRFPDVENYTAEEMEAYNKNWHEVGDVREWEKLGYGVKVYQTIPANELWNLINICATYSAEPGIFFIDNANRETNATSYGQKVVATNPCFHPNTRISTEFGLITIEDLYKQQGDRAFKTATDLRLKEQVQVVNGRTYEMPGVAMRNATVFPTGERKTLKIQLKNGMQLNVTPDHRVYTNSGWKEAKDLTQEDDVYIQSGAGNFSIHDDLSEESALFLGWLTGDGWLAKDGRVGLVFGQDDSSIIPSLLEAGESLSGLKAKVHERKNGTFQVMYNRKSFTEQLEQMGVKRTKAHLKRVPDKIFTATKENVVTFLRALFSADGTVYTSDPNHRTARLTSSSQELLRDVQLLLLNLGIHAKIYDRHKKNQAQFTYTTVDGEEKTYESRPFYELIISGKNLNLFKEDVGFLYHTEKEEKLSDLNSNPRKREYFISKVDTIEEGEYTTVYDITEPETHSLIANGFVAHNCGEQPLAPYSVCNLAAVNLASIADKDNKKPDFEKLEQTVATGVRMQDNVIDSTPYFLEENRKQALGERRVGLGVMGLHDLLIYCETEYGSTDGDQLVDKIFETIATTAYRTSIELAKEKGSFPFLVGENEAETKLLRERFIGTGYMQKMPEDIKQGVLDYGIRNSHLLTVAPTGSTGTMVGVSTGLEPYFSFTYYRSGRLGKFIEVKADIVQEYYDRHPEASQEELPEWFVTAMSLSPEAHADTQCVIQKWVDSSISKTVNAPKGYSVEQVEQVYRRLYNGGAKGGTVYVDGSRDTQVLSLKAEENDFSEQTKLFEDEEKKVVLMDTVSELDKTNVNVGSEVGDTCPVCRQGNIEDVGGCNTCTNCGAQLKCGL